MQRIICPAAFQILCCPDWRVSSRTLYSHAYPQIRMVTSYGILIGILSFYTLPYEKLSSDDFFMLSIIAHSSFIGKFYACDFRRITFQNLRSESILIRFLNLKYIIEVQQERWSKKKWMMICPDQTYEMCSSSCTTL